MVSSRTASFVRKTKQKASYIGFCRLLHQAEACRSLRCSTHDLTLVRRRRCPAWFDPHRPQQLQESKYSESYVYFCVHSFATHDMDPADSLQATVRSQGVLLGTHEQALQYLDKQCQAIRGSQKEMFSVVKDIHTVLTPATSRVLTTRTVPADAAEVVVSYPALAPSAAIFLDAVLHTQELYHGKLGGCSGFLMQCSQVFSRSSPLFPQRRCCSELMGGESAGMG